MGPIIKKLVKVTLLCSFFLLLTSCSLIKPIAFKGIENYEVLEASFSKIKLKINVKLHNPNPFKISLKEGDINVHVNDINLGDFKLDKPIVIQKKAQQTLPIVVEAKTKSLLSAGFSSIISLFSSNNVVAVHLKGHINAKVLRISKKINVDAKETIKL